MTEMISGMPLVSVLMTVYNRGKYLEAAISSVLASSFMEFELIIVDDCSDDNSREIALKYASKDHRIKFYQNEQNLGDYHNRNKAASYATGKYLKYVDADDLIYPWCLEVWVREMEKYPSAGFSLESVLNDTDKPLPELLDPYEAYLRNFFQYHFLHKAPTSSMIRTDIFRKHNGFSGKRMVGDMEFWLKLSAHENVLIVPNGLTWYRKHDAQESVLLRGSSLTRFLYLEVALESMNDSACPLDTVQKNRVIRRMKKQQGRSIIRSLFIERKPREAVEKMRRSNISFFSALRYSYLKEGE
jgi:glycosyltransferase involved in cell wall biosynthesis